MVPTSIVELSEVTGRPRVKMTLPYPLQHGSRVALNFRLQRENSGRHEVLEVTGDFRVESVSYGEHQTLSVQAVGKVPTWRSVKKLPPVARVLAPARSQPVAIE